MVPDEDFLHHLMQEAIAQARIASTAGEVPIGAVLAHKQQIISRAHNFTEAGRDVTLHAEIQVLREASRILGNWRLPDTILCVTLEPCVMCAGALRLARVPHLVYGASDNRFGVSEFAATILEETVFGTVPKITSGIMAEECSDLLRNFFQTTRRIHHGSENIA